MNKLISLTIAALVFSSPVIAGGSADQHNIGWHNGGEILPKEDGHNEGEHGMDHSERGHIESAAGNPGRFIDIDRTIQVSADDSMRFAAADWQIKKGETIRFIVTNNGQLPHEFAIGDQAEMREHAAMMRNMPSMKHDEGNAISLAPGETGQLIWTFTRSGTFEAACNVPGHYEAGMKAALDAR